MVYQGMLRLNVHLTFLKKKKQIRRDCTRCSPLLRRCQIAFFTANGRMTIWLTILKKEQISGEVWLSAR